MANEYLLVVNWIYFVNKYHFDGKVQIKYFIVDLCIAFIQAGISILYLCQTYHGSQPLGSDTF